MFKYLNNLSQKTKGYLTIFGSCLIYLVMGSSYIWGGINIYAASYYKFNFEPDLTLDSVSIVFSVSGFFSPLGTFLSLKIAHKMNFNLYVFLGSLFIFGTVFASSFVTIFWIFVILFSIMFGFSCGFFYLLLILNGFKYFPKHRGRVTGVLMGIYGLGGFIFTILMVWIINPNNVSPTKDSSGNSYFSKEIYDKFPESIRLLSYCFAGILLISNLFIFQYKEEEELEKIEPSNINDKPEDDNCEVLLVSNPDEILQPIDLEKKNHLESTIPQIENDTKKLNIKKKKKIDSNDDKWPQKSLNSDDERKCFSLKSAMKTLVFYQLVCMIFFSSINGYFIASNYKNYGITKITNDSFLTMVGSISALFNGGGRFSWGFILDRFQFKRSYFLLLFIQIILIASMKFISSIKPCYFIWVCFMMFCEGGHFVLFPPECVKIFGPTVGAKVYTVILVGFSFSNLFQYGLTVWLKEKIGYEGEFWIFLGFTIISLVVLQFSRLKFRR